MGVLAFHRLLIGTAIVFCFGFGVWLWPSGSGLERVFAACFFAAGAGLGYYLLRLRHFLGLDD